MKLIKRRDSKMVKSIVFTAGIVLMGLGTLLVCSLNYINGIEQLLHEEKSIYLAEVAIQTANLVKTRINTEQEVLAQTASLLGEQESFDVAKSIAFLNQERKSEAYKRMGIISPDGTAVTTDGLIFNLGDRAYFKQAMAGIPAVSDTLIDKIGGEKINIYAVPIHQKGQVIGVLFATLPNDSYMNMLKIQSFGGKGYIHIVKGSTGEAVVKSNHPSSNPHFTGIFDEMFAPEDRESMRVQMQAGGAGTVRYSVNGSLRWMSYQPIGINDWYVLSVVPESVIQAQSNSIVTRSFVLCGAAIVIVSLLSFYLVYIQRKGKRQVEKIAFVDGLTGAKTKTKFEMDAEQLLKDSKQPYAFVLMDVDKFRVVNDLFQYSQGDILLQQIAAVLKDNLRESELFSRFYSDQFYLLMEYESDEILLKRLHSIAQEILRTSTISRGTHYNLVLCGGIFVVTDGNADINSLSDRARLAHKNAKGSHTSCFCFYDDSVREKMLREKEIENHMANGLKQNEFITYLQPKYDIQTEQIAGAEALVRWIHPKQGFIQPGAFIPVFEKNGFVAKLDFYVFEQVCEILAEWIKQGVQPVCISVNFSRIHLTNTQFVENLFDITQRHGVPTRLLEIELTESVLFDNHKILFEMLQKLHRYGFTLSMDDFGSGYSSLGLLKNLPVDVVKLDRTFFTEYDDLERSKAVISNVMAMVKQLGIHTVAEGVETEEQVAFLKEMQCDMVQGYYYAKPMPINAFEQRLIAQNEQSPMVGS